MSTFEAKYKGTCSDCHEPIEVGDQVVYVNDELVHVDCEGSALADVLNMRPRKKAAVCERCFMEKPCGCDDGQGPKAAA
jgi:hypothetical protein